MEEKATREIWEKRVERWADSGLTANDYASELGISAASLKWWKWRLAAEADGRTLAKKSGRRRVRRRASVTPMSFVEIPTPVTSPRASIEVVLPSRVRIRLRGDVETSTLERVLALLERPR